MIQAQQTAKRCTRCKEIRPLASFGRRKNTYDGLEWNCRECRNAAAREYRETHLHYYRADRKLRASWADHRGFAKHTCRHIAEFTERRIAKFESKTGQEAPPELKAILDLALSLADRTPDGRPAYIVKCPDCQAEVFATRVQSNNRCVACRKAYRAKQQHDWHVATYTTRRMRPRLLVCQGCAAEFEALRSDAKWCPACRPGRKSGRYS